MVGADQRRKPGDWSKSDHREIMTLQIEMERGRRLKFMAAKTAFEVGPTILSLTVVLQIRWQWPTSL
jgi:hypothetical protein